MVQRPSEFAKEVFFLPFSPLGVCLIIDALVKVNPHPTPISEGDISGTKTNVRR